MDPPEAQPRQCAEGSVP